MQLRFSKCPVASCGLLQVSCGSPAAVLRLSCGVLRTVAYDGHELPEHSNFQITLTSRSFQLPDHYSFQNTLPSRSLQLPDHSYFQNTPTSRSLQLPDHSNFQNSQNAEWLALANHSYFKGVSYMAFRQIKPPHKATRTATHSCRDPEMRMSFLVARWHPPQGLNQNSWCRI